MSTIFDRLPMLMGDPQALEEALDKLADTAPAPSAAETASFFGSKGLGNISGAQSPNDVLGSAIDKNMVGAGDPVGQFAESAGAGQLDAQGLMGAMGQFLGAKDPEAYKPQFAPLGGTVRAAGNAPGNPVQSQVLQTALQGAQPSPVDTLAQLIMQGVK